MPDRSHLRLINPQEGLVRYVGRPGGGGNEDDDAIRNYVPMAESFARSRDAFLHDQEIRHSARSIEVPQHFDIIEITFQGYFDQPAHEAYYYETFGLALMHLEDFNHRGLFAIDLPDRFDFFLRQIDNFINKQIGPDGEEFDRNVLYVREFAFYGIERMRRHLDNFEVVQLSLLTNNLIENTTIIPQSRALMAFLDAQRLSYSTSNGYIEVFDTQPLILDQVLSNFDIIYSACSNSGAVIRPGSYNNPERAYGFTVVGVSETLPIVGIVDTGIQRGTPLDPLIIDGGLGYDLTGSGLLLDEVDHGTSIACLAALGKAPIPDYRGEYEAFCRLFPIKVLNTYRGFISPMRICNTIRQAHTEYGIKIFTLTIGYRDTPLSDNQNFSAYARLLDELTHELDILILISTTNNIDDIDTDIGYPEIFREEISNIASPAESLNNMTVGAISDNVELRLQGPNCLTPLSECPSSYTRKFHYDWGSDIFNQTNINRHLRKPDVLFPGGEYEILENPLLGLSPNGSYAVELLSSDLRNGRTSRNLGTSISVGFAANFAAKLLSAYPELDMQTIKALIINSGSGPSFGNLFEGFSTNFKNRILGFGIANEDQALNSDENRVTLILEDEIEIGYMKSYPIRLPDYLSTAPRRINLLTITATLAFKFRPIDNNQLLYCPIHISFIIGKNLPLENDRQETHVDEATGRTRNVTIHDGINGNSSSHLKINSTASGWAQDYYYKAKVLSNLQKVCFNISRDNLINENNQFKIGIGCEFHKLLPEHEREPYRRPHSFSLIITIEQNPRLNEVYNDLYEEIQLVNDLMPIVELEANLEV